MDELSHDIDLWEYWDWDDEVDETAVYLVP